MKIISFITFLAAMAPSVVEAYSCDDVCATTTNRDKDPCSGTPYGCDVSAAYVYCQIGGAANDGRNDGCRYQDAPGLADPEVWCLVKSPELDPYTFW